MLVEGRLEPDFAQSAPPKPPRIEAFHGPNKGVCVDIRGTPQLERTGGPASFGEGCAFKHDSARIAAGHVEAGRAGAGIDPPPHGARPAESGALLGTPARHLDHPIVEVE